MSIKPSEKNIHTRRQILNYLIIKSEVQADVEERRRNKTVSENTNTRKLIHILIGKCIKKGKSDDQILAELEKNFNNSGLECYYKGYICDYRRKIENSRDDEGR